MVMAVLPLGEDSDLLFVIFYVQIICFWHVVVSFTVLGSVFRVQGIVCRDWISRNIVSGVCVQGWIAVIMINHSPLFA